MKQRVFNKKEELVNDKHIEDWEITKGATIPKLLGRTYEKKFFLKNTSAIDNLTGQADYYKKKNDDLKKDCGIRHITCRFEFGNMKDISLGRQKKLIDFQAQAFDDVTVFVVKNRIGDFEQLINYAISSYPDKILAAHIDICNTLVTMMDFHRIIKSKIGEVSYVKYEYKKIVTWLENYIEIKKMLLQNGKNIQGMLTGCNKRCGIENAKDVAVSIVAAGMCGFDAICLNFRQPNKAGFSPTTDLFDNASWEYKKYETPALPISIPDDVKGKSYRIARLESNIRVNLEINNMNPKAINMRTTVQGLFRNLVAQGL